MNWCRSAGCHAFHLHCAAPCRASWFNDPQHSTYCREINSTWLHWHFNCIQDYKRPIFNSYLKSFLIQCRLNGSHHSVWLAENGQIIQSNRCICAQVLPAANIDFNVKFTIRFLYPKISRAINRHIRKQRNRAASNYTGLQFLFVYNNWNEPH